MNTLCVPSQQNLSNPAQPQELRFSEILSALSYALDLTEGQPMGHSVRSCILGMRIAKHIGLPVDESGDLYYALLLKDAGCSSNASRLFNIVGTDEIKAKRDVKTTDWTKLGWESLEYALSHVYTGAPFLKRVQALFSVAVNQKKQSREMVQIRCERGAGIARRLGLSERTALGIQSLDEHWDGCGFPDGLERESIPMLSRIMNLAQTLEVFFTQSGAQSALDAASQRSRRWFDPDLVKAALSLSKRGALWNDLDQETAGATVLALEPEQRRSVVNDTTLDNICLAFADVIDAKSPFTYRHSNGVADAAVAIARQMGLEESQVSFLRRAALLHDIGKLSVPNSILEKPGKLTNEEWACVKKHPYYTLEVLRRIPGLNELSETAAAHHEKLDGSGYFRGWGADQLSLNARILVVADIYDALAAKRPYRDALPADTVFGIIQKDSPTALDATCVEALRTVKILPESMTMDLANMSTSINNSQG